MTITAMTITPAAEPVPSFMPRERLGGSREAEFNMPVGVTVGVGAADWLLAIM